MVETFNHRVTGVTVGLRCHDLGYVADRAAFEALADNAAFVAEARALGCDELRSDAGIGRIRMGAGCLVWSMPVTADFDIAYGFDAEFGRINWDDRERRNQRHESERSEAEAPGCRD